MSLIPFDSNIEIRLRQIVEILSREERNLANNPAGLARAADFLQSLPYRAWRKLVNNYPQTDYSSLELKFDIGIILKSLEWSRSLTDNTPPPAGPNPLPATFDAPHYKHTNMLNHLNA